MALPGFTAERAVYVSGRVYASRVEGGDSVHERIALARMNDGRGDTAGEGGAYDPDKGRHADPYGAYGPPIEDSGDSVWDTLFFGALAAIGAIVGGHALDCTASGGRMKKDSAGQWVCVPDTV